MSRCNSEESSLEISNSPKRLNQEVEFLRSPTMMPGKAMLRVFDQ
jgi:hypothetical protein